MLFGRSKLELKVGIFVFIGLAILMIFILAIGDFRTWSMGYSQVNFIFNFVNGVKIGAPVRFAGVGIGEVKGINFVFLPQENKTKVKISGWIRNDVKIPSDSSIWINTLGLLGEKYVEIMPGKNYDKLVKPDADLMGDDPLAMHEVGNIAKNIASDIDETVLKIKNAQGTIGRLLYEDAIYRDLEELVKDLKAHPWKLFFKTKEKPLKK